MSVLKFKYVLEDRSYSTLPHAPSKSMKDILDQFKALNTLKTYDKNCRPFEDFERIEKDIIREHMSGLQRKIDELKNAIESGKINPEEFNLEITSVEECEKAGELLRPLIETMVKLPSEERAHYEEAMKNIVESSKKYDDKKRLGEMLYSLTELRRPYSKVKVRSIKRRLEEILNKQELLTHEDIRFIAKELLPLSSRISPDYLERLESRLRTDVMERRDLLKKVDPISMFFGLLEKEIKPMESSKEKYSVIERIAKYLWVTVTAEFAIQSVKLSERWEKEKEYTSDQYIKDLASLNYQLYSLIK